MGFEYIALFFGLVGLVLFAIGVHRIRHRHIASGCARCVIALLPLALAGALALVAFNLYTYARLTEEQDVARLAFEQLAPQRFAVQLKTADGRQAQFELAGDEWQLDARVLKWESWANLAGLHTLYRLERLSGRYDTVHEELNAPRTVITLSPERGLDVWSLASDYPGWVPLVDARYGSATYLPMGDGARYQVRITTSGLIARPVNTAAQSLVDEW